VTSGGGERQADQRADDHRQHDESHDAEVTVSAAWSTTR
jgi:hypothetical protein